VVTTWKKLAFADEVATLSDEDPHDIGTVAAEGVATDASRHDHIHIVGTGAINAAAMIANDVVGSEHIETLSAALDFGKQQATAMCLDNETSNPATPALGQIYFHAGAGELHPYICTVV